MEFDEFIVALDKLKFTIESVQSEGIDLSRKLSSVPIHDFKEQRKEYQRKNVDRALEVVKRRHAFYRDIQDHDDKNKPIVSQILDATEEMTLDAPEIILKNIDKIKDLADSIKLPPSASKIERVRNLPEDISFEINADISEMERCFNAKCYRSVVILCGRILETALHRKYYETTGNDILEKNPGIGLGNLIAKLSDKQVTFDPGLTQQIHLINQVRIFSVHKKKDTFHPNHAQSQAMILYTIDVLKKMFK